MYGNDKSYTRYFGDSSQVTNWILYSGATCHMTPQVSNFISGLLEDRDKYIGVEDDHYITDKQKGQIQIRICGDNGYPFITTFHSVLLVTDLCNKLFLNIMLMNYIHACLFNKGFCMVYFGNNKKNAVTLPHSAQKKHAFLVKTKEKDKSNNMTSESFQLQMGF